MEKKYYYLHDITSSLGTFLTFSVIYLYLRSLTPDFSGFSVPGLAVCLFVLTTDTLSRIFIKNFILYIFIHLISFGIFFTSYISVADKIILGIIISYIFINSIQYWIKNDTMNVIHSISLPQETLILYVLILIHSFYALSHNLTTYVYIAGVLFFSLSLLNRYYDKIILNLHSAEVANKHYSSNIYSLNSALVGLFLIFIILVIAGLSLVLSENSFNFIGKGLKFVLRMIISLLSLMITKREPQSGSETAHLPSLNENAAFEQIESNDNPVADAIFLIFQIVIYIAIFSGIVYSLYHFFKDHLYRNLTPEDEVKNIDTDKIQIKKALKKTSFSELFKSTSVNDKIRRLYFKKINSLQDTRFILKQSNTPDEISTMAKDIKNTPVDELSEIYIVARYSNHPLNKDDLSKCKQL